MTKHIQLSASLMACHRNGLDMRGYYQFREGHQETLRPAHRPHQTPTPQGLIMVSSQVNFVMEEA